MASAIVALGLLVWLGRNILMDVWPNIAGFYQRVGAEPKKPGGGLKIAEFQSDPAAHRRRRDAGGQRIHLEHRRTPETVPNLKLELYDQKHQVIQDAGAKACAALLDPGGTCQFELKMELPQMAAAKGGYGVVWAKSSNRRDQALADGRGIRKISSAASAA